MFFLNRREEEEEEEEEDSRGWTVPLLRGDDGRGHDGDEALVVASG